MNRKNILDMIATFFKRGYIVREPTSSPIILALRDIERTDWLKTRQIQMAAIEFRYRKQSITPQQLTDKIRKIGKDKFSKKDNILIGVWNFLNDELKTEEEYQEAIEAGATEILIPLEIGETGIFIFECDCHLAYAGLRGDRTERIELTIYEHNLWECPHCERIWALRNMACIDVEEDDE